MNKLKLELDALKVESFRTTAARIGEPGTVRAHGDEIVGGEEAEAVEVAITSPPKTQALSCFGTCGQLTCAALCTYGCSDGCTVRTCASGGDVCCA